MWQFIPVIGSIANAFSNYFSRKLDTDLEKYKVKGSIDVEALRQDTEIIKARAALAAARATDPADRIGRSLLMYPTGVWFTLVVYDSCFRNLIPDYTWRILELPGHLNYIPYAVVAYLLVTSFKK